MTISDNLNAWLKIHVAMVRPVAKTIRLAGGSNYRLARKSDDLVLMIRSINEILRIFSALHILITLAKYRFLAMLPEPLLVALLSRSFNQPRAELVLARHANAARDEMTTLAEEFRSLINRSGVPTPATDALHAFLDPSKSPMPEGSAKIPMDWRSTIAATGALISAGILSVWLLRRPKS